MERNSMKEKAESMGLTRRMDELPELPEEHLTEDSEGTESRMRAICAMALATWGTEAQTRMVFEEMAELQKELCKFSRGKENRDAIAEEIADVEIVLEQMKILHDCEEAVEGFKASKLKRLALRIETARMEAGSK